ncbi:MAG TPA: DsrE family protein [Steroidobacteraceae bacterium]|jgi:intracellular sulfur oxidation DsrE/DsrF family protein
MHRIAVLIAVMAGVVAALPAGAADESGLSSSPAIEGYGKMHPLPKAAYQPNPRTIYKVVFAMTAGSKAPEEVNPAVERVARAVNLYVSAGVPLDHLKFVAVAYGPATSIALDDPHYKSAYGMANPNLPVIARLRKAGVDVAVCGQAVLEHKYEYEWIDHSVTVALSALTTVTSLEQQGYHLMPLF